MDRVGKAMIAASAAVLVLLMSAAGLTADSGVRPSALAGTWYPASPDALSASIERYLDQSEAPPVDGRPVAVIVPHAGHKYSGAVAAKAFRAVADMDVETVIMIGPSHRFRFSGASINQQTYQTPLGSIQVDLKTARAIDRAADSLILSRPDVHGPEHCLEIELPFIQTLWPEAEIVPVLMGAQDWDTCRELADAVAQAAAGKKTLLLASTDLSHFHTADQAEKMDRRLIEAVEAFSTETVHQKLASGRVEACGGGPMVTVMMAAQKLGADRAQVLEYAHSGMVTGDDDRVVGYVSVVLTDAEGGSRTGTGPRASALTPDQQRLLAIAREAMVCAASNRDYQLPSDLPEGLESPRGAFVTIKKNGALRGCIGRIVADRPLAQVVADMARAAALEDPRFPALTAEECGDVRLEISVLTPFEPVVDLTEVRVGRDGLIVRRGSNQGLLLPQVPVELGWDRETFLNQTCGKAGMGPQCWKFGAAVYRFTAEVFGEEKAQQ
jgi:AmmeMemoRadiSam system protein B/AmmeMemoRadiSam system protein A